MRMFEDIEGTSVFITGGGSGIGAALTEAFIAAGAQVAFVQRSDATAFCDRVEDCYRRRPHFIACDLSDTRALEAAVSEARDRIGPIRVLVNNAANDARCPLERLTVDNWDEMMAINLRPHAFTAKAIVPDMVRLGGGSIINFSSISYKLGSGDLPAYAAAKAGITGLTRSLARAYGKHGIRANALLPGWVLTERQRRLWADSDSVARFIQQQCLPRELNESDIVGPTLFLASNASAAMTGQALIVDGGKVLTG